MWIVADANALFLKAHYFGFSPPAVIIFSDWMGGSEERGKIAGKEWCVYKRERETLRKTRGPFIKNNGKQDYNIMLLLLYLYYRKSETLRFSYSASCLPIFLYYTPSCWLLLLLTTDYWLCTWNYASKCKCVYMSQLLKLSRVNFPTLRHFVNCLLNHWQLDIEHGGVFTSLK